MTRFEETQLADTAIAGDAEALQALWTIHRRWVAAVILEHKPRQAELDDLLQEVAMTMVKHVHTLKDPASVRPWLRTIALNIARPAGRRQKLQADAAPTIHQEARRRAGEAHAKQADANDDSGRSALRLARTLPAEYREPLLLRAVRGLSYRQIADAMGVPITTVDTRIARARLMLRIELDRLDAQDENRAADSQKNPSTHPPRSFGGDPS